MKNYMFFFKFSIAIIIIFLFFSSCNKEGLLVSSPNLPNYLVGMVENQTCFEEGINGSLIIQSYGTNYGEELTSSNGFFNGIDGAEDKGNLKIGNIDIQADNGKNYQSNDNFAQLFGTSTSIELKENSTTYFNTNFRLPNLVEVTYPLASDEYKINTSSKTISWEQDTENDFGVAISIEYTPHFLTNIPLADQGHDKIIVNTLFTQDNGNYEFTPSDFDNIPLEASVFIRIARGTCDLVTDSETDGKYFIYGLSMVDVRGIYEGLGE